MNHVRSVFEIEPDGPTALGAAAIALLALRASLAPLEHKGLPDVFRLEADDAVQPLASAARVVAALPKPLRYGGEVSGGAINVKFEDAHGVRGLVAQHATRMLSFVYQRYGPAADQLRVACLGAGVLLRVNVPAVAEWERDYALLEPWGSGADFTDTSYASARGVRSEDIRDCVALISFGRGLVPFGADGPPDWLLERMNDVMDDLGGPPTRRSD
jgi:hypothetical protein